MKKTFCLVAALLLVPTIAAADDFSAALTGGGAQGIASIVTGGSSVSYAVVTAGIGNVTGAEIRQGGGTFVNLNASSSTGSAAGTVNTGADLSALEANPGSFSVRVTGSGGSVEGPLQLAGESGGGGGEPGVISIASGDLSVSERVGGVTITVSRSGGGAVSVDYATADGTAAAGTDYTAATGTLSWADGDTAPKTVDVAIIDDGEMEDAESFSLAISNPTGGATLGDPQQVTVTVNDNDTPCDPNDPTTLCLRNNRFEVSATFETQQGGGGDALAGEITDDTGYLHFGNAANVEVVVKVLNACVDPFNRFWVFAGGLTNVEVNLQVRDTSTGDVAEYTNPLRTQFQPIQDTDAFATCP